MTTIKVNDITNVAGTGAPNFSDGLKYNGAALSTLNTYEYTSSATEPSNPSNGALWWDSANSKAKIYVNNAWKTVTLSSVDASTALGLGDRALAAGGGGGYESDTPPPFHNIIYYFDITTSGNASDFGDLTEGRYSTEGASNGSRGMFIGGGNEELLNSVDDGDPIYGNTIDYVTISTLGNATDFGDFNAADGKQGKRYGAACHNTLRAVYGGGRWNASAADSSNAGSNDIMFSKEMHYFTIATTGNATLFGDMDMSTYNRDTRSKLSGAANATRGIFSGGIYRNAPFSGGNLDGNVLDYITIDTTGNSTDFGDLLATRTQHGSCANSTRILFCGGLVGGSNTSNTSNSIEYATIDTTGNAIDFGDLTRVKRAVTCTNNSTKAVIIGGRNSSQSPYLFQEIDIVTIATTGNATDHGDLFTGSGGGSTAHMGSCSGAAS